MSRANRVRVEGGYYHVYNLVGRGERVFDRQQEAEAFVSVLRDVAERDGLTVLAWSLMSNHYHLAVRTGTVSLDRPVRSLQQRVTRGVNLRRRVYGPLWQGRYKAKLIKEQSYLDQLLIYIHLNPVAAGLCGNLAEYRWSGHLEILGKVEKPLVDVDEVLSLFGGSRRTARARYVRRLKGASTEQWISESPGRLPWWRLGRPPEDEEDPETALRARRLRKELGPHWRPHIAAAAFVARGTGLLGVGLDDLRSRQRGAGLARARELGKSPDGMTQAIARGARRKLEDGAFRADLDRLDKHLAESTHEHQTTAE
jgi:REP element-mobilizing transposase RayT